MTEKNIPSEAGEQAPYAPATVEPPLGAVGTGDGYSGQEYDSKDQARWRRDQEAAAAPAGGDVHGSGTGIGGGAEGEDFDSDSAQGERSAPLQK
jgi:hypothetical protein